MHKIEATDDLTTMLASERALLFKHSPRCGLSASARLHVEEFVKKYPAAEVYVVDVIEYRSISREAESQLGVRHETPQVILVEGGKAVHQASHRRVNIQTLSTWWEGDESGPADRY